MYNSPCGHSTGLALVPAPTLLPSPNQDRGFTVLISISQIPSHLFPFAHAVSSWNALPSYPN